MTWSLLFGVENTQTDIESEAKTSHSAEISRIIPGKVQLRRRNRLPARFSDAFQM
jgi:hypothetical protein